MDVSRADELDSSNASSKASNLSGGGDMWRNPMRGNAQRRSLHQLSTLSIDDYIAGGDEEQRKQQALPSDETSVADKCKKKAYAIYDKPSESTKRAVQRSKAISSVGGIRASETSTLLHAKPDPPTGAAADDGSDAAPKFSGSVRRHSSGMSFFGSLLGRSGIGNAKAAPIAMPPPALKRRELAETVRFAIVEGEGDEAGNNHGDDVTHLPAGLIGSSSDHLSVLDTDESNHSRLSRDSEHSLNLFDMWKDNSHLKRLPRLRETIKPLTPSFMQRNRMADQWRRIFLALTVALLMGVAVFTRGKWLAVAVIFSPIYSFILFEWACAYFHLKFERATVLVFDLILFSFYFFDATSIADVFVLGLSTTFLIPVSSLFMTDCSTTGEKGLVFFIAFAITSASILFNIVWDHPCSECALHLPTIVNEYIIPTKKKSNSVAGASNNNALATAWQLLLEDSPVPRECGLCFNALTKSAEAVDSIVNDYRLNEYDWIRTSLIDSGLYGFVDFGKYTEATNEDEICLERFDRSITTHQLRLLDKWYEDLQSASSNSAGKKFVEALAMGVSTEEGKELLANVTSDFLCSPASRLGLIGAPSPSQFVSKLLKPRYTGESTSDGQPMDITLSSLRAIMRGDAVSGLEPDVCFMGLLISAISEDTSVLEQKMIPANLAPVMNENQLKGSEVSFMFPSLFVPKLDEDLDPDGLNGDFSSAALGLYQRLPMKDGDTVFLHTKEEYIAFFRFNLEYKLQDEYYFPRWLSKGAQDAAAEGIFSKKEIKTIQRHLDTTGDIISEHFKHNNERLRLTNATSDETLSDRAFYGSGMRSLARMKIPNDLNYGYLHSLGPRYYSTQEERTAFDFRPLMPTTTDLEHMISTFTGKDQEKVVLEKYRKRVVEVNYIETAAFQHRPMFEELGSILYLDVKTRRPMGIWVSSELRMILPSDDPESCKWHAPNGKTCPWERAKLYHRSTGLALAATRHAGEYHIGIANTFSTSIRQTLPENHGLRSFLKPYTHGTGSVNWVAYEMLLSDDSLLHRSSGFTRTARGKAFGLFQKHLDFTNSLPRELEAKNLGGMGNLTKNIPLFTKGMENWNIHRGFVDDYLRLLYPTDAELVADAALVRFWAHINTFGRHSDPCVCGLESSLFYEPGHWPAFEETRTCTGLLDHAAFLMDAKSESMRRDKWCFRPPEERTAALYSWLEDDCAASTKCPGLSYDLVFMRPNMGLPKIDRFFDRKVLIDVLTKFIFEVTLGHEMAADNVPYMVDPSYGNVRLPKDPEGNNPLTVDFATYIFGNVVSAVTTIRSMPLLSDWSDLLVHWVEDHKIKEWNDDQRAELKKQIKMLHLKYKADLVALSHDILKESQRIPQNRWAPPLNPATQACSIAV